MVPGHSSSIIVTSMSSLSIPVTPQPLVNLQAPKTLAVVWPQTYLLALPKSARDAVELVQE